jgi:hypothetical protein
VDLIGAYFESTQIIKESEIMQNLIEDLETLILPHWKYPDLHHDEPNFQKVAHRSWGRQKGLLYITEAHLDHNNSYRWIESPYDSKTNLLCFDLFSTNSLRICIEQNFSNFRTILIDLNKVLYVLECGVEIDCSRMRTVTVRSDKFPLLHTHDIKK